MDFSQRDSMHSGVHVGAASMSVGVMFLLMNSAASAGVVATSGRVGVLVGARAWSPWPQRFWRSVPSEPATAYRETDALGVTSRR